MITDKDIIISLLAQRDELQSTLAAIKSGNFTSLPDHIQAKLSAAGKPQVVRHEFSDQKLAEMGLARVQGERSECSRRTEGEKGSRRTEGEISDLKERFHESKIAHDLKDEKIYDQKEEIANLEQVLLKRNEDCNRLADACHELQKENAALKTENKTLSERLEIERTNVKEWKDRHDEVAKKAVELRKWYEELKVKCWPNP